MDGWPTPSRSCAIVSLTVVLAIVSVARAQQNTQRIGYVYPAGGRQGSTFQVTVGGQNLQGVSGVHVSGDGVKATVVDCEKPLTSLEFDELRGKLKELMEKKKATAKGGGQDRPSATTKPAWTTDDEKMLAAINKRMASRARRQSNPAIADIVTVQVTMTANAGPGERELRLETPGGLTNPLVFCVGQLPEVREAESASSGEPGNRKEAKFDRPPQTGAPETETTITLPAIVNGQITPGDVDLFRFQAHKGERLVVAASARALVPYLPDAVPGWFQAVVVLYDAKGKELAYDDDYRFHPDPVLFYQITKDGEYVVEIRDALYRGREDFVYRIALGQLPFVTSIFPLGCKAGDQARIEVKGWNLPQTHLTQDARNEGPGVVQLTMGKRNLLSNHVPFALDDLPECLEKEPNNKLGEAQPVVLPLIVNGRVDRPGDWDVFRFEGRRGDEVVAEVYARRLDSPVDSVLELTDATGRQLAYNDDHEDKGAGLTTHHADSWLRATLPADGSYDVHVGDAQHKGGPEYAYRLRISAPRPDFELRIVPSSINVRGGTAVITVYALRKDGFAGEIPLALKNAPAGFVLSGARVPANQDQVRLTLTVPPAPIREPLSLSLEGRAVIQGRKVVRPVVPAEDMMQAFAYRHLVPAKELMVTSSGRRTQKDALRILTETPVKIPAGGTARVQVGVPTNTPMGKVQLELSDPPEGIAIRSVSPVPEGAEIVLQSDARKVKPGMQGNLIVNATVEGTAAPGNEKAQGNRRRMPTVTLPAVPFEIVGK